MVIKMERLDHQRLGLLLRRYNGEQRADESVHWLTPGGDAPMRILTDGAELAVTIGTRAAAGATFLELEWRVVSGEIAECAAGIRVEVDAWSTGAYPWMAGAAYNGNRFTVRRQPYSPRYPEADARPDAETVITDIPHLEKGAGRSRIQLLLGDLSAPAIGYVDPRSGAGLHLCTDLIDTTDLFEIAEADDRSRARFSVLRGGVREGRYSFREMRSDAPSGDRAPTLRAGDTLRQRFRLTPLREATVQHLFDTHFDWMMTADALPRDRIRQPGFPLEHAFRLIEEKFNRDNWDEAAELYATTCDTDSPHYYQTGWCGGGIADSALLCGADPLSRQRAERALNRLCREGQLPSGFFHGKRRRDGAWSHDFAFDAKRPYTHRWHLVRREGDLLLYLLKAARRPGLRAAVESVALWRATALKLADALCGLWEREGQLGQFIDAETGAVLVGGSASGGVVPAGLCLAYRESGDTRHLETARAIADYFIDHFTRRGLSTGGPGDACQAPDSESCAGLLESYVTLYEATREARWLQAARDQAAQLASWVMPYDFPFPPDSEFGRLGIPSTGSVVANAQNGHSAPGICTHSGECLKRLYDFTGDVRHAQLLEWIVRLLPWTVSRADRPIHDPSGRALPPGWINERLNTSDWDDNIGGVFYGSTWCEVSLMLTAVELSGFIRD
jgi:hypothetical protein